MQGLGYISQSPVFLLEKFTECSAVQIVKYKLNDNNNNKKTCVLNVYSLIMSIQYIYFKDIAFRMCIPCLYRSIVTNSLTRKFNITFHFPNPSPFTGILSLVSTRNFNRCLQIVTWHLNLSFLLRVHSFKGDHHDAFFYRMDRRAVDWKEEKNLRSQCTGI